MPTRRVGAQVGTGRTTTVIKMMGYLRAIGRVLLAAQPLGMPERALLAGWPHPDSGRSIAAELAMGNIVRRVLFIIRDEYAHMLKSQPVVRSVVRCAGLRGAALKVRCPASWHAAHPPQCPRPCKASWIPAFSPTFLPPLAPFAR